ncbi:MAG: 2-C-methyl-D-erythritol 4-phosphate cytidylyltransferase [Steroidobacteraceae bacterium]
MTAEGPAERCWAIVPAAGRGERFGTATAPSARKQYSELAGSSVIEHALRPLLAEGRLERVVVALAADDDHWAHIEQRLARRQPEFAHRLLRCVGGENRQASVLAGLEALAGMASPDDWILVHDAARPCLGAADLCRLLDALPGTHGALLAVPVSDTLKRMGAGTLATVDRAGLWRALTPQAFRFAALRTALLEARRAGRNVTDEAQAMELAGVVPTLVTGSTDNIKITHVSDLALAERSLREGARRMRIGQGMDVHAFTTGDHVMLGGVRIAHSRGILAHSDGDVIIHALCDALLGALGEGDIGRHFPDTDPRWRGADSRLFLREVAAMMRRAGLRLVNADITVAAQAPRLAAHVPAMLERLAADLATLPSRLCIKATTTERLGFIGREEGLAATAVVLLEADADADADANA